MSTPNRRTTLPAVPINHEQSYLAGITERLDDIYAHVDIQPIVDRLDRIIELLSQGKSLGDVALELDPHLMHSVAALTELREPAKPADPDQPKPRRKAGPK